MHTTMYYHHSILLAQTAPEHVLPLLDKSLREVGEWAIGTLPHITAATVLVS